MSNDITLGIRMTADGRQATAEIRAQGEELKRLGGAAEQSTMQGKKAADEFASSLSRMGQVARTAFASVGLGIGLGQIGALTDEYTKFTAQLKLATASTGEYAQALSDVRSIARGAQASLGEVGVLYARIATGARELGLSQQRVSAITESVSLALKASGATGAEASSAMLQLSQAFSAGALRGEEFNAVNEAAPRLMRALAEGIGVPVGQLRAMAEAGRITSDVMANALPKALGDLRQEAAQVQTIAGAFVGLKNNVMEYIGTQAQASGSVAAITGAVGLLSENLRTLTAVVVGVAATKLAGWIIATTATIQQKTAATVTSVAAMHAERAATIASTAAEIARAESTLAFIAADRTRAISQLQSAQATITATAAMGAQSGALAANTAAVAANAAAVSSLATIGQNHSVMSAQLTAAQTAHSAALAAGGVAATGLSRVLGFLGGPIGAITTLLGLGAAAWVMWGGRADEANKTAAASMAATTPDILRSLEKQNEKLRERLALVRAGNPEAARQSGEGADRLASLLKQINDLKAQGTALTKVDQITLIELEGRYRDLTRTLGTNAQLTKEVALAGQQGKAGEWMEKYATRSEKLAATLEKARAELGAAFTPGLEQRIRDSFAEKGVDASAKALKERAQMEENYRRLDAQGWVRHIEDQTREYEDGLRTQARATDAFYKEKEKLQAADQKALFDMIDAEQELAIAHGAILTQGKSWNNQRLEQEAEEARRLNDDINRGLTDALFRGFEAGKGFFKNFKDTLLNGFQSMVLKPVVQFVLAPVSGAITATLGGLGIPGVGNASTGAGGGSGILDLLSGGNSLYNAVSGNGGIASSIASALGLAGATGATVGGVGAAVASGALFGTIGGGALGTSALLGGGGAAAGAFGSSLAFGGTAAGLSGGAALASGGAAAAGIGGGMMAGLATAAPYIAAAVAIASALGVFGKKKDPAVGTGYEYLGAYTPGSGISNFEARGHYTAGKRTGYDMLTGQDVHVARLAPLLETAFEEFERSAKAARLDTTALRSRSVGFDFTTNGIGQAAEDASGAGIVRQVSSQWAALVPGLREMAQANEDLIDTFNRVAQARKQADLDAIFGKMTGAINARDQLQDLWLSDLSPLTAQQRLARSQGDYAAAQARAESGDFSGYEQAARAYVQEGRSYYASSPDYTALFNEVQSATNELVTDTLSEQSAAFGEMGLSLKDINFNIQALAPEIASALKPHLDAMVEAQRVTAAAQMAAAERIVEGQREAAQAAELARSSAASAIFDDYRDRSNGSDD